MGIQALQQFTYSIHTDVDSIEGSVWALAKVWKFAVWLLGEYISELLVEDVHFFAAFTIHDAIFA